MQINKKTILLGSLSAAILGLATIGIASATSSALNPMDDLVTAIATKFNLNKADVQQVFDQHKQQMFLHKQQRFAERLAQAVKDGRLTQQQADAITAKQKEMEEFHKSLEGKTPEEIKAALQTQMQNMQQWATENNIPKEFLLFHFKHSGHGMGKFKIKMMHPQVQPVN